jgi:hypothetical protein
MNDAQNAVALTPAPTSAEPAIPQKADPLKDAPKFETEHTFKLLRPVQHAGQTLTEIKLRAPTGLDILEVKTLPTDSLLTDEGVLVRMNADSVRVWLQRLSDYPMPVFYALLAPDFRAMYNWVSNQLRASAEGN